MKKLLALAALVAPAVVQAELPVVQLNAGMHLIKAEVAADFAARAQGLMYRTSLPPNGGMLFIFEEPAIQCMWMKNTLIPLSVAFLDERGTILNIEDMKPQTEDTHCARAPAALALEMTRGWFAQRGIRAGMQLGGLERLRTR
ncbi:MAG TPA: DUF192 domain-containing protein [Burkholderiales bacterium]|nr:DUF192 domain-containing protein [Burkholderiales bacterium]